MFESGGHWLLTGLALAPQWRMADADQKEGGLAFVMRRRCMTVDDVRGNTGSGEDPA